MNRYLLGLSHLLAESPDPAMVCGYWLGCGWTEGFAFELPVSGEKRQKFLFNSVARNVMLRFMSAGVDRFGVDLEFLQHKPFDNAPTGLSANRDGKALISVCLQGPLAQTFIDPDGNTVVLHPDFAVPATLCVRTYDAGVSGRFLRRLGFEVQGLGDAALFSGCEPEGYVLKHSLFSRRGVRIVLRQDIACAPEPRVDGGGFAGFTLLTRNLEGLRDQVDLCAFQSFSMGDGRERRVAFTNEGGVLVEFLEIKA